MNCFAHAARVNGYRSYESVRGPYGTGRSQREDKVRSSFRFEMPVASRDSGTSSRKLAKGENNR